MKIGAAETSVLKMNTAFDFDFALCVPRFFYPSRRNKTTCNQPYDRQKVSKVNEGSRCPCELSSPTSHAYHANHYYVASDSRRGDAVEGRAATSELRHYAGAHIKEDSNITTIRPFIWKHNFSAMGCKQRASSRTESDLHVASGL